MSQSKVTSIRLPLETAKALARRSKRLNMSQNQFIVGALDNALGLSEKHFDPNPPLPTDEAIAKLEARVAALEHMIQTGAVPAFMEEQTTAPALMSREEATQLAITRGLEPDGKRTKTPAVKRFGNKYNDYAVGKTSTNPEELWGIKRVTNPNGRGYLYQDIQGGTNAK